MNTESPAPTGAAGSRTQVAEQLVPEASLALEVEREIREGKVELPMLSEAAVRVREIVATEGPIKDIVTVIERDPALAAALLRFANSVAFAGLQRIVDLNQAVARLGLNAVEQTVLAISAKGAFQPADPLDEKLLRRLWEHSITTAIAARRIAPRASNVDREQAFLGGLLHDIGKVVILRCAAAMRKRPGQSHVFPEPVLLEFFDALHCTAGRAFLESWNIPRPIQDVVSMHHDQEFTGPDAQLVAIVAFADDVAAKLGVTLNPGREISLLDTKGAKLLRLNDLELANLLVDIEDDIANFRAAF